MNENEPNLFIEVREISWRGRYNAVISSTRWRRLRQKFIDSQSSKCSRCGWEKKAWDKSRKLELHHKTYERLGNELDSDLELICSDCHKSADAEREIKSKCRSAQSLYDAQFHGWAEKVYGENYYHHENESMHDRFIQWQERKEIEDF